MRQRVARRNSLCRCAGSAPAHVETLALPDIQLQDVYHISGQAGDLGLAASSGGTGERRRPDSLPMIYSQRIDTALDMSPSFWQPQLATVALKPSRSCPSLRRDTVAAIVRQWCVPQLENILSWILLSPMRRDREGAKTMANAGRRRCSC